MKLLPILFGIGAIAGGSAIAAGGVTILGITIGASIGTALTLIGTNMLINGITDLLTPDPVRPNVTRQEDPQDPSYIFTGLLNNTKQGVPINIIYGEVLVGSTVVSSSVDSFQATYQTGGL